MARAPSLVSEISAVEDFDLHRVKSDGAVVRLVAVVSADDSVRGGLDAAEIFQQSFVLGSDIYGRSDLATVSMTGLPSSIDGLVFSDTATVALTAVPTATEFHSVIYTDTATAALTGTVTGSDVASFSDSATAFLVARIYNLLEAAIVTMVSQQVEHDDTHQAVDAATITMTLVPSTTWEVHKNLDEGTATLVAVPSAIDGKTWSDDDIITVVGTPSSTDFISHTYIDLATVTMTAAESDTEIYGHEDAATVTLTGVITALDIHENVEAATETLAAVVTATEQFNGVDAGTATLTAVVTASEGHELPDAATATLIGVPSGVEVYTPASPAHANETYIVAWGSSANGGSDQGHGGDAGNGTAWTFDRVDGAVGGISVSTTESSHTAADLPIRTQDYQFFSSIPADAYGYFFAVGDALSPGVNTSKTSTKNNPPGTTGTSSSASTAGYTLPSTPSIGNLVLVFLTVRGGVTASTPTDSSGDPYTLFLHGTSAGSLNHYLWYRVALHNDGAYVVTSSLSGSASWRLSTTIIDTPSSTTIYEMYEGAFVNNGGNPLRMTLTAGTHHL